MKKWSIFILLALCWLSSGFRGADRFSPDQLVFDAKGDFPSFDFPEMESLAGKPMHFLGQGMQSIAFASADGEHVVKFFFSRKPKMEWSWSLPSVRRLWPSWNRTKKERFFAKNQRRVQKILDHYALAFHLFREETALVAVHLGQSVASLPPATLVSKEGIIFSIDLNRASFVIQKRCRPLTPELACQYHSEIQDLMDKKAQQGLCDKRGNFKFDNYGILNQKVVMIDPGNLLSKREFFADQKGIASPDPLSFSDNQSIY